VNRLRTYSEKTPECRYGSPGPISQKRFLRELSMVQLAGQNQQAALSAGCPKGTSPELLTGSGKLKVVHKLGSRS
jgi:hypothetical protein